MALAAPTLSLVGRTPTSITVSWPAATGGSGNYTYNIDQIGPVTSPYTITVDPADNATPLVTGQTYSITLTVVDTMTSDTADSNQIMVAPGVDARNTGLSLGIGLRL